nr:hypothetical protein [Tanacetum cinerariifolium]
LNLSIWHGFIEMECHESFQASLHGFIYPFSIGQLPKLGETSGAADYRRRNRSKYTSYTLHSLFTSFEEYQDIWLGHLKELEVTNFNTMTEEWSFLKLILAKSPMLKKVRISYHQLYVDEHHKIMKKLSGFRHASKDVDFILTPMEDDFW